MFIIPKHSLAFPLFTSIPGARRWPRGVEGGKFQAPGLSVWSSIWKTLLAQQGFVPSAWQGVGDSGVTLGLAGNVGLWREMKPGFFRGVEFGLESSGLCRSEASARCQQGWAAGESPAGKSLNSTAPCASISMLWGLFSLCSAVSCGTKSTAEWCPLFSHITVLFLGVFLYKILSLALRTP